MCAGIRNEGKKVKRAITGLTALILLGVAPASHAFDPVTSVIGKGISTPLDVRSKAEVEADVAIDAALTKRLVEHKGDEFKNIAVLVFARHAVLVGFAATAEAKKKAEDLARGDKRLRSLKNDIVVGRVTGGVAADTLLEKKIDLKLTAAKGVHSVNMRWKVYGGDVFLTGVAKSAAEVDLALRTVKAADGVKTVHSSLRVGKK